MAALNHVRYSVRVNPLHGNGMDTYCKITQYEYADGTKNKYTFSFGTGRGQFCMIVSIGGHNYTTAYIDRVERLEQCAKGKTLSDIVDAMGKFVPLGLYAIKEMCPWVKRFTLKDDSKLYCNGERGPSIGMAYDYIIKYNMTWYQKKFGAQLDGLLHSEEKEQGESSRVIKDSLMDQFITSLQVLDAPCSPFPLFQDSLYELNAYRDVYEVSTSPRDFLSRVRAQFPDPASFCRGVSSWFDRYMGLLHIRLFMDAWFIPVEAIKKPVGFRVSLSTNESVLKGGRRETQRSRRTGTKRHSKKIQGMGGGRMEGSNMGVYE